MPRFYHVTKLSKVPDIKAQGLKPSSGIGSGGMSSDSQEAYKYAEQDRDLIYLWVDVDYTDRFKKEGEVYALIIVDVDALFVTANMGPPKSPIGTPIPGSGTTAVCNAIITVDKLSYKKTEMGGEFPLTEWGVFNMELDKSDKTIWGGMDV